MKKIVSLYWSSDKNDEAYWNIAEVAKAFNIKINHTSDKDWGGENVFQVEGSEDDLEEFAIDFCAADSVDDLYPSIHNKEEESSYPRNNNKGPFAPF